MTPNDVKIVADNIDDFIEVPNGIERLRKAVLTLAVAGKLVVQDKKEGTAEDLYIEIQTERSARKKEAKTFALVTKEEVPFEIPTSWKWVRMGDIGDFGGGSGFPKEYQTKVSGNVPFFKVSDMNRNVREMRESENWITEEIAKKIKAKILPANTIIFPKIGGAIATNKRRLLVMPSCIDNNCLGYVPNPKILGDWMFLHLTNIDLAKFQVGSSIPALNIGTLDQILVSLPPLAEQKRIVKKVAEVMKQLEELEAKKRERDETRTRLACSAMQSLGKGESKIAFEHLTELIKTPADLKELEIAIFGLATSGWFMKQTISAEGAAGWKEKRLSEVAEITSSKRVYKNEYSATGVPFYRINEISALDDGRKIKTELFISEKRFKEIHDKFGSPQEGDVLLTAVGTIGKIYIVNKSDKFYFKDGNILWFRNLSGIEPSFLRLVLTHAIREMQGMSVGAVYKALTIVKLKNLRFLLPPITEQRLIVKKVEEVMSLVNKLKPLVAIEK